MNNKSWNIVNWKEFTIFTFSSLAKRDKIVNKVMQIYREYEDDVL